MADVRQTVETRFTAVDQLSASLAAIDTRLGAVAAACQAIAAPLMGVVGRINAIGTAFNNIRSIVSAGLGLGGTVNQIIGLQSAAENTRLAMASTLRSFELAGEPVAHIVQKMSAIGDATERTNATVAQMHVAFHDAEIASREMLHTMAVLAAPLPGEVADYVGTLNAGLAAMANSGMRDLNEMATLASHFTAIGIMNNVAAADAANQFNEVLQGRAGVNVRMWGVLQPFMTRAEHSTARLNAQSFNALSAEQRRLAVARAMVPLVRNLGEAALTYDAVMGGIKSTLSLIATEGTAPIFDAIKRGMQVANTWLDEHKTLLTNLLRTASTGLMHVYDVLSSGAGKLLALVDRAANALKDGLLAAMRSPALLYLIDGMERLYRRAQAVGRALKDAFQHSVLGRTVGVVHAIVARAGGVGAGAQDFAHNALKRVATILEQHGGVSASLATRFARMHEVIQHPIAALKRFWEALHPAQKLAAAFEWLKNAVHHPREALAQFGDWLRRVGVKLRDFAGKLGDLLNRIPGMTGFIERTRARAQAGTNGLLARFGFGVGGAQLLPATHAVVPPGGAHAIAARAIMAHATAQLTARMPETNPLTSSVGGELRQLGHVFERIGPHVGRYTHAVERGGAATARWIAHADQSIVRGVSFLPLYGVRALRDRGHETARTGGGVAANITGAIGEHLVTRLTLGLNHGLRGLYEGQRVNTQGAGFDWHHIAGTLLDVARVVSGVTSRFGFTASLVFGVLTRVATHGREVAAFFAGLAASLPLLALTFVQLGRVLDSVENAAADILAPALAGASAAVALLSAGLLHFVSSVGPPLMSTLELLTPVFSGLGMAVGGIVTVLAGGLSAALAGLGVATADVLTAFNRVIVWVREKLHENTSDTGATEAQQVSAYAGTMANTVTGAVFGVPMAAIGSWFEGMKVLLGRQTAAQANANVARVYEGSQIFHGLGALHEDNMQRREREGTAREVAQSATIRRQLGVSRGSHLADAAPAVVATPVQQPTQQPAWLAALTAPLTALREHSAAAGVSAAVAHAQEAGVAAYEARAARTTTQARGGDAAAVAVADQNLAQALVAQTAATAALNQLREQSGTSWSAAWQGIANATAHGIDALVHGGLGAERAAWDASHNPHRLGAPAARGGTTQNFYNAKFSVMQHFDEGFDPDRIAVLLRRDIARQGERQLGSAFEPAL